MISWIIEFSCPGKGNDNTSGGSLLETSILICAFAAAGSDGEDGARNQPESLLFKAHVSVVS